MILDIKSIFVAFFRRGSTGADGAYGADGTNGRCVHVLTKILI